MAEYYGKLKDNNYNSKSGIIKKIFMIFFGVLFVVFLICALIGIFGDTERRDETRAIIIENSELRQQIYDLSEENESLKKEVEELKKTLAENALDAGTTLTKPADDMNGAEANDDAQNQNGEETAQATQ